MSAFCSTQFEMFENEQLDKKWIIFINEIHIWVNVFISKLIIILRKKIQTYQSSSFSEDFYMDDDFRKMDLPKIFKKLFLKKQLLLLNLNFSHMCYKKKEVKNFHFYETEELRTELKKY